MRYIRWFTPMTMVGISAYGMLPMNCTVRRRRSFVEYTFKRYKPYLLVKGSDERENHIKILVK